MTSACPGCGLELPAAEGALHDRYNSSPACWQLFGELSAYTLSHSDPRFIHQHAVDTWQAQHAVSAGPNIGIAFSLIGLYLALEKGYTGRQVQLAHMQLGKTKRQWGEFIIPSTRAALTVRDVLDVEPGPARDLKLIEWARAVWVNWSHARPWTLETCARLLHVS